MPFRTLTANRGDRGRRLDRVLADRLVDVEGCTRSRVQHWLRLGKVSVNGALAHRAAARVHLGDRIVVALPEAKPRRIPAPEDLPLTILYEDDWLLVVNKPAGLVVHPAYKHAAGTLLNALLWHGRAWPAGQRPTIVGRLDRDTSGLVVVAKTRSVHAALQRALAVGEKDYLALVYGRVGVSRGRIDLRLARAADDHRRVVVASSSRGLPSVTRFERIATSAAAPIRLTLLRCRLVTGRMHQIRVHLAARGWPIVGDRVYGGTRRDAADDDAFASALRECPRQALHAWRCRFVHPGTGGRIAIEAPVPADLARLLRAVGVFPRDDAESGCLPAVVR